MSVTCEICEEKIEIDELGKFAGTIVKRKKNDKNEKVYICSKCQKEGNKLE